MQRNRIERTFGHLKIDRAIATRYDQLADSFLGMVILPPPTPAQFVHAALESHHDLTELDVRFEIAMCFCDLIEREGLAYDRAKAAESQAIENEGFRKFQRSRISDHFMDEIAAQCQRFNENLKQRERRRLMA